MNEKIWFYIVTILLICVCIVFISATVNIYDSFYGKEITPIFIIFDIFNDKFSFSSFSKWIFIVSLFYIIKNKF